MLSYSVPAGFGAGGGWRLAPLGGRGWGGQREPWRDCRPVDDW